MSRPSRSKPALLIVDDDKLVLSSLKSLFLLETDYELLLFDDAAEAMAEARRRPIDLVISDFLMPGMNGVEFLGRLRETQPDAIRILLTGYADKESAIEAINKVGLYHYLEKPWDNQELLLLVRNALREGSLRRQLSQKVAELESVAREHSTLSKRHGVLERELDMAARVHKSLLPEALPEVSGFQCAGYCQPSSALGGDFYDWARGPGGTMILVSDASGHGVQAALTSMLVKAVFQEAALSEEDPEGLLQQMNPRLHRFLPSGMFVCAALARIGDEGEPLQVTNAGLPHPFLLRREAGRMDELPLTGMPLGIFPEVMPGGYDTRRLSMEQGDVLLLSSDGLGEIRGGGGEFFQDGLLPRALAELNGSSGQELIGELMRRARAFHGGSHYADDVTLVTVTKT